MPAFETGIHGPARTAAGGIGDGVSVERAPLAAPQRAPQRPRGLSARDTA
jgi:hypothetical protein